jgi:SAM-dependent methyltransferase
MYRGDVSSYGPATYGDRIASMYDAFLPPGVQANTDAAVAFLRGLAGDRRVLELGIGTGRVALPLAALGVDVHGIDASEAMLARLREKPGGAALPVTVGDFADVEADGEFGLVYVVFNTFFALLSQVDQVRCFRNVAAHLETHGRFVIEAFVPDPTLYDRGQRVNATRVEVDRLQLDVTRHDPMAQQVISQHVLIGADGIVLVPVQLRYAWPSELDLMAALAGMELDSRAAGWRGDAFGATSSSHVSVYVKRAV